MSAEADVHAWTPVLWALQYPGYFYPATIIVFLIAAAVWWWLPNILAFHQHPYDANKLREAESSLRTNLSLVYRGCIVVFGLLGAVIQFQANVERDQYQRRAALSAENSKRFDAALAQIEGKSSLSNLGGIVSLSELTKQDGFYWHSVVTLHAFMRMSLQNTGLDINRPGVTNALLALSERDVGVWNNRFSEPFPLDFSAAELSKLKFSRLKLWGSDFQNSNFSDVWLPGAKLEGSDFACANFENAHLEANSLFEATEPTELGPKLSRVNFRKAWLNGVKFKPDKDDKRTDVHVETENACFEGAHLEGADISHFDLKNVDGLNQDQISRTSSHPDIPPDFAPKPCEVFKRLCPATPKNE